MHRPLALVLTAVAGLPLALHAQPGATAQPAKPASQPPAQPVGAAKLSDPLPTDPRLVTGQLENGLRYVILKHATPPGRAAVYMHVSTGSLNETEKQRGAAHYLEHLAFNGSENFPPGKVVPFFESLGLTFGQHQNAFTSFDQTTYILELPDNTPETMGKALSFFSDVAGRLLLLPEEIDRERQVILEEKRSRLGAQQRVQEYILERLMPGSLVGARLPIGTEETLAALSQADFKDYYSKFYTPSNTTVLVVADTEPAQVAEQITGAFGAIAKADFAADQDPKVTPYTETRAIVATDPELTSAQVSIARVAKVSPPPTTYAQLRERLVENLATNAYSRRMEKMVSGGEAKFLGSAAFVADLFRAGRLIQVGAEGQPEKWEEFFKQMALELQRARLHGLSQREIDDAKADLLAGAQRFVQQESTLPAAVMLRRMNSGIAQGEPLMGAQQELDALNLVLPTISAGEASARFAELFDPSNVTFIAELPSTGSHKVPTETELVALGRDALSAKPEKAAEIARITELMPSKPAPGKVVDQSEHEASQVLTATLENGVTVHHRFMDYRKDEASVVITLAGGQLQESAGNRGVADAATLAFGRPATSALSSNSIKDFLTGKNISVGGGAGMDTVTVSVGGSPADLELGMQLAHLLLTDPKIEAAALDQWKDRWKQAIEQREKDPQAAFSDAMARALFPSDIRGQPITQEHVDRMTLGQAQAWLTNVVRTAPIEVSIVGDLPRERAIDLATTYLGSLPKRERMTAATLDELRTVKRPDGPVLATTKLTTETPVAVLLSGFFGSDADNIADTRALDMAGRVLSVRMNLELRERESLVYSIGAQPQPGRALPGFGLFLAASTTAPEKADTLGARIVEMYRAFAQGGPTDEEMTVAKVQVANALDEQMRDPRFWTSRLSTMAYRESKLDDALGAPAAYQAITAVQVKEVFNKYFSDASRIEVCVKPEAAPPAEPTAGGAPKPGAGESEQQADGVAPAKAGDVRTLPSGVQVEELVIGTGAPCTSINQTIRFHYRGSLKSNGKEFQSSFGGQPVEYKVTDLVKGWQEGIPGMKVGGKRKLVIPAAMGYGSAGRPPTIPPNADLVFEIELLNVR
ncbi:MAG: insulinase family protein [Phycisphaerales bacterium]|nr:insulinase family protein [Phycisphaerales bacterium]